jgi:hypothetical protein
VKETVPAADKKILPVNIFLYTPRPGYLVIIASSYAWRPERRLAMMAEKRIFAPYY